MTPTESFRVTMNSFLAAGGDGFTGFNEGVDALGDAQDIDALVAAFAAAEPAGIAVPPLDRIVPPGRLIGVTAAPGQRSAARWRARVRRVERP